MLALGKSGKYYTTDVGSNRESCRNKFSLGLVRED
jgi:hypothetical protein